MSKARSQTASPGNHEREIPEAILSKLKDVSATNIGSLDYTLDTPSLQSLPQ